MGGVCGLVEAWAVCVWAGGGVGGSSVGSGVSWWRCIV